jgi:urease accessory protein
MLIQEKKGNVQSFAASYKTIDIVSFEWYETNKRIQRKVTKSGTDLSLKFLNDNPAITEGDILFEDENLMIVAEVMFCDCLVVTARNMFEMASVCYEIGNKHLPLFFENEELLIPFEKPLHRLLTSHGYIVKQEKRKLLQPLKTTVAAHGNSSETLFSKIMKLTTTNE